MSDTQIASQIVAAYKSLRSRTEVYSLNAVFRTEKAARMATQELAQFIGYDVTNPDDPVTFLRERIARAEQAKAAFTAEDEIELARLEETIAPLAAALKELRAKESKARAAPRVIRESKQRLETIQEEECATLNTLQNAWRHAVNAEKGAKAQLAEDRAERSNMESIFGYDTLMQFMQAHAELEAMREFDAVPRKRKAEEALKTDEELKAEEALKAAARALVGKVAARE